jgi:hypothetical protein
MDNTFNIEMDQVGSDICTILEHSRRSMFLLQVIVFLKNSNFPLVLLKSMKEPFFLLAPKFFSVILVQTFG